MGKYSTGVGVVVDFSSDVFTMPMSNLVLYAGWLPRTYTARFHMATNPANSSGASVGEGDIYAVQTFVAGSVLDVPDDPTRAGMNFEYWGYYKDDAGNALAASVVASAEGGGNSADGSGDLAFTLYYSNIATSGTLARVSFTTTTFLSDVDIFAVWNSSVPARYKVNYVLRTTDDAGEPVEVSIADSLIGEGISGQDVTVSAKVGDELYEGYRGFYDGGFACYAEVGTHTIALNAAEVSGGEVGLVEYTFYYVKSKGVTYAVNYWLERQDAQGNAVVDAQGNPIYDLYEARVALDGSEVSFYEKTTRSVITVHAPDFKGYSFVGESPTIAGAGLAGADNAASSATAGSFVSGGAYQVTRMLTAVVSSEGTSVDIDQIITPENTVNFYYDFVRPATYELPATGGVDIYVYVLVGLFLTLAAVAGFALQVRRSRHGGAER
jgi:LPXTG-motif cell wall-anchored protein